MCTPPRIAAFGLSQLDAVNVLVRGLRRVLVLCWDAIESAKPLENQTRVDVSHDLRPLDDSCHGFLKLADLLGVDFDLVLHSAGEMGDDVLAVSLGPC